MIYNVTYILNVNVSISWTFKSRNVILWHMSCIRSQTLTSCRAVCPYLSPEFGSAPFVRTSFRNCRSTWKKKNQYHCLTLTNKTSCSPKVHQRGTTSCFTRYLICVFIAGRQGSKVIQKPFIQLDLLSIYSVFIRCKTIVFAAYIFLYKDNGFELGYYTHNMYIIASVQSGPLFSRTLYVAAGFTLKGSVVSHPQATLTEVWTPLKPKQLPYILHATVVYSK